MAKPNIEWDDNAPTLSIDVTFDAAQMKQLLAGDWVRLEEVTAKTLHEVAAAMSDSKQAEIDDLEWEQARLRYYIEALERRLDPRQRQQAADEAMAALAQHNPPQWVWDRDEQVKTLQARILQLEVDRSKAVKLRDETDNVIWSLKPDDVPGAINWGDLGAREIQHVTSDDRQWWRVVIEEADPSNPALHAAVLAGLVTLGWTADDIEIETAW